MPDQIDRMKISDQLDKTKMAVLKNLEEQANVGDTANAALIDSLSKALEALSKIKA